MAEKNGQVGKKVNISMLLDMEKSKSKMHVSVSLEFAEVQLSILTICSK